MRRDLTVERCPAEPHLSDETLAELVDLFRSLLRNYAVADELRYELAYLLGGPPQITIEEFALRSIRATALLGAERASDMILSWIEGKPFHYQRSAVISGLRTAQPFEWGGMYFASLPEGALLDHVPRMIVEALGSDNLSRAVKMSVPCELRPAFYVPGPSDQVPLQESNPMPPLNNFSRAMSLQCSSHVMYKAEWVDYGDLLAFDPIHGQQRGYGMPPHDLEVLGLPPHTVELTEEHLAGAMSSVEKLAARADRRSSVNVAIHRWMNSKQDIDFPDRFIELRIALEALYAKGGKGSLTSRVEKNGARHLAANPAEMSEYRTKLRALYKLASDAIHNTKEIEFSDDNRTLLSEAQDLCRKGILNRLDGGLGTKLE